MVVAFAAGGGAEAVARRKELSGEAQKKQKARPKQPFATAGCTLDQFGHGHFEPVSMEEYAGFVAAHGKALKAFAALRDEQRALRHLAKHHMLLEGIAHVRLWFFARHVDLIAKGKATAVQDEAAGFFLLDAAADAAKTVLARGGAGGFAASSSSSSNGETNNGADAVSEAAMEGVSMLAQALGARGDPVGLRPRVASRVGDWMALAEQKGNAKQNSTRKQQLKARQPVIDPARLLPGLGFDVLGPIAAGAFSTILRCREANSGREVAVKSFDAAKCAKDWSVGEARDRELHVLRLLGDSTLDPHPHIANMLGEIGSVRENSPHVHAILEYCGGGSLKRYLQNLQKATPLGEGMKAKTRVGSPGMAASLAARAAAQLADALAHLHALEIAHGDVKPANILLVHSIADHLPLHSGGLASLHLKLCDFGFACVCGDRKLKTYCGTPAYLAPEAVSETEAHKGYLGRPVDMWALGCVLYEMLHGKAAFAAPEAYQLHARVRACRHHPIDETLPPQARHLIAALLVISPSKRLTAEQVLSKPWVHDAAAAVGPASGASSPVDPTGGAPGVAAVEADNLSRTSSKATTAEDEPAAAEQGGLLAGMWSMLSA